MHTIWQKHPFWKNYVLQDEAIDMGKDKMSRLLLGFLFTMMLKNEKSLMRIPKNKMSVILCMWLFRQVGDNISVDW
ncbi:hypothetical protein ACFX2I_037958 [Malus domestica]